jgi:ketosteroid isomerase-like protein
MTTDHKATVEAVNAAFSNNNIEAFLDLCTDDIEMGVVGREPSRGKDALRREMGSDDSWNPPVIHVTDILVSGDKAVCDGMMDMDKKIGEKHRYGFVDCYTFRDGLISAIRVYMQEMTENRDSQG